MTEKQLELLKLYLSGRTKKMTIVSFVVENLEEVEKMDNTIIPDISKYVEIAKEIKKLEK